MYGKQLCTISLFQLLVWDVYLEASAHGEVQKIKKNISNDKSTSYTSRVPEGIGSCRSMSSNDH